MQPDLITNLLWVPVITLLCYIPLVCYLDVKYREVDHYWWTGLVLINIPVYLALLSIGIYQWWMCLFAFVGVIFYFIMMRLHYIEGADFVFISMILIFLQFNPVTQHWFMTIPFSILLVGCLGVCGMWLVVKNIAAGKGISFELENGFPMMLPISAAFVLTVMLV